MTIPARPITVLIAALGGEGGGVLTNWIIAAAEARGFPTQSTSIPGVAQRTGATTYYIEIVPVAAAALDGRRPVLALTPGVGDIDLMVASELMEAGRAVAAGFVTADRTLTIASTHRQYVMTEKTAMGDGRFDGARLAQTIAANARAAVLFDMDALARDNGAMINAVMLGAIAGCGRLPIPAEAFEAAIRREGKGVEANLRGFRAGRDAVGRGLATRPEDRWTKRPKAGAATLAALEQEIAATLPDAAREFAVEGVRRLTAYQDLAYARRYLDRLKPIAEADARAAAGGRVVRETARHLAVRMSFEDVIRVAEAKIDPARVGRIAASMGIEDGDPFTVAEFLKPGIEEICSLLPPRLARPLLALAERRGWLGRVYWGMEIQSTSVSGYLRFWALARLKRFRPASLRFHDEQAQIEGWLADVAVATRLAPALALEIAECARLIKGYGDTHARGITNYRAVEAQAIKPALVGRFPPAAAIDAVASARTAALVDPDGESLAECLAGIARRVDLAAAAE